MGRGRLAAVSQPVSQLLPKWGAAVSQPVSQPVSQLLPKWGAAVSQLSRSRLASDTVGNSENTALRISAQAPQKLVFEE